MSKLTYFIFIDCIDRWTHITSVDYNTGQLFHQWFEIRIFRFTNASDVYTRALYNSVQWWCNEQNIIRHFLRLPFDSHTPFGYFIAYLTEAGASVATFLCVSSIICFLIGSCWLFSHFVKDIADDLPTLDNSRTSNSNRTELMKYFIQSYSVVTELSKWKKASLLGMILI